MMQISEAVIYCRVSSKRQLTEGHGNDSQEHICRRFADMEGYKVVRVFQEPGISGAMLDRPAMQELIAFLKQHKKEMVVIFDDLKRFSRDVGGYWELEKLIKKCGARLASPKHIFEDTAEGRFIQTMLVASGQLEREQNQRQVVEKMKARLELGYYCLTARIPGYVMKREKEHGKIRRRIEPDATHIADALTKFAAGILENQVDIQHFLQERRFNKGKVYLSSVRRILENSLFYAGWLEYKKWDVTPRQAHHDALITLETHIKIKERLEGKLRNHVRKDLDVDFPHRGFITCAECGKHMTASWSKGRGGAYPYYRCTEPVCSYYEKSINRDKRIEPDFQKLLTKATPIPKMVEFNKARLVRNWQKKMLLVDQRQQDIAEEIQDTSKRVDLLVEKAELSSSLTATTAYERKIEKLELYRKALEEKLANLNPVQFDFGTALTIITTFLSNPLETWLEKDFRKQQRLLQMMFSSHLAYHPKTGFGTPIFSLTYATLSGVQVPQLSSSGRGGS